MLYATIISISALSCYVAHSYVEAARRRRAIVKRRSQDKTAR
jgi:hypothetical protein